jgi:Lon protease-like protein
MLEDASTAESLGRGALAAHGDARQLVRLVQCPRCSKPFTAPVTLPCGHTFCQPCLPEPQRRCNISYPETLDHQLGIACPTCGQEESTAECNVDVTFAKLMSVIAQEIAAHAARHKDTPILLEEILHVPASAPTEKEGVASPGTGRCAVLPGGRLAATFAMAQRGLLLYSSDVSYRAQSPTPADCQDLDMALLQRLRHGTHKELDCLVCYNTMQDPITTTCGHTFCRRCLMRAMDHSSICPVCRRDLHIPASLVGQPSNFCLASLLRNLCPDIVDTRERALKEEERAAPEALDLPLFVCTLSLPSTPTFLHIFEPRYRLMMRRCMDGNKRFGMLMYNQGAVPQGSLGRTKFLEYGCLLEIVDFQLLPDGRSLIETRGLGRFRVLAHDVLDGYDIGRVERVDDVSLGQEKRLEAMEVNAAQAHAAEYNRQHPETPLTDANFPDLLPTLEIFQKCHNYIMAMQSRNAPWLNAKIISAYGDCPTDPAIFPYWFATVLPIAEEEKYILLQTTSVRQRLKIVHSWICRIENERW